MPPYLHVPSVCAADLICTKIIGWKSSSVSHPIHQLSFIFNNHSGLTSFFFCFVLFFLVSLTGSLLSKCHHPSTLSLRGFLCFAFVSPLAPAALIRSSDAPESSSHCGGEAPSGLCTQTPSSTVLPNSQWKTAGTPPNTDPTAPSHSQMNYRPEAFVSHAKHSSCAARSPQRRVRKRVFTPRACLWGVWLQLCRTPGCKTRLSWRRTTLARSWRLSGIRDATSLTVLGPNGGRPAGVSQRPVVPAASSSRCLINKNRYLNHTKQLGVTKKTGGVNSTTNISQMIYLTACAGKQNPTWRSAASWNMNRDR